MGDNMKIRRFVSATAISGGLLLAWTALVAGQQPPPINGVTGTIALEGTVQKTYSGVNTLVVKTVDGVEHLFHLTDKTAVHGGKSADDDALRGIDEGSRVVVHYTAEGNTKAAHEVDRIAGDGLKTVEGVIVKVDRRAQTISIRLADGTSQTLRLTERAASDVGKELDAAGTGTAKVVVYVNDEGGRRVAHYFKRVS
jgi:hypothetical protein